MCLVLRKIIFPFLINMYSFQREPDARQLRARSIENWDEQPGGQLSEAGAKHDSNPPLNEEEDVETPVGMFANEEMWHDNASDGMQGSSQQTRARPSSSSHSKQPLKRRRSSDIMLEMMSAMAADIGSIAGALTENNRSVCLDELFEMVQTIPGFDDDPIIETCEYLSFDERRAMMFMKLNERSLQKKLFFATCSSPRVRSLYTWRTVGHVQVAT